VAHLAASDEASALDIARRFLGFLPPNNMSDPPLRPTSDPSERRDLSLDRIVPDEPTRAYDMEAEIHATVDDGDFLEPQPGWARTS
jgi:propionyl-CoA carboxylase beta chain